MFFDYRGAKKILTSYTHICALIEIPLLFPPPLSPVFSMFTLTPGKLLFNIAISTHNGDSTQRKTQQKVITQNVDTSNSQPTADLTLVSYWEFYFWMLIPLGSFHTVYHSCHPKSSFAAVLRQQPILLPWLLSIGRAPPKTGKDEDTWRSRWKLVSMVKVSGL